MLRKIFSSTNPRKAPSFRETFTWNDEKSITLFLTVIVILCETFCAVNLYLFSLHVRKLLITNYSYFGEVFKLHFIPHNSVIGKQIYYIDWSLLKDYSGLFVCNIPYVIVELWNKHWFVIIWCDWLWESGLFKYPICSIQV